jgi:hypothetical protein
MHNGDLKEVKEQELVGGIGPIENSTDQEISKVYIINCLLILYEYFSKRSAKT